MIIMAMIAAIALIVFSLYVEAERPLDVKITQIAHVWAIISIVLSIIALLLEQRIQSLFWLSVIKTVPWLALIIGLGYFLWAYYEEDEDDEEDDDYAWKNPGWRWKGKGDSDE